MSMTVFSLTICIIYCNLLNDTIPDNTRFPPQNGRKTTSGTFKKIWFIYTYSLDRMQQLGIKVHSLKTLEQLTYKSTLVM